MSAGELQRLIACIENYLHILAPLNLDISAFVYVEHWLEEAFQHLNARRDLYYDWALAAQSYGTLVDYPPLDERLWDLENRVELALGPGWKQDGGDEPLVKFAALIAAYNGDPATASAAWEKLGQIDLAASQARAAGDLERAYNLLRRHNKPVPEEVALAVKILRQAAQLEAKHHHLTAAERETLLAQLDRLAGHLRPPD